MEELMEQIRRGLAERGRLLIAVDGRCGCGKSSLAASLAEELDGNVFHTDDFYLPFAARTENWREIPAGNMDLARFKREVLEPLGRGEAPRYRAWDCRRECFREPEEHPFRPLSVVEGSYALHPLLREAYDLRVFVTAEPATQRARLRAREGRRFLACEELWIPLEERYFRVFRVEECADLVLRTD